MSKISDDDVLKLAKLSRIKIGSDEIASFRSELESIISYVDKLKDVDTTGLEPTNQVTGLSSVMRDDEVVESSDTQELLKNLPNREKNQIKVRKVL